MMRPMPTNIPSPAPPSFYQLLQMDAHGLWARIHSAASGREKARLAFAMAIRSLLLVTFAILFIGILTALFGNENSGLVVAGFCILLGIKHVPFGYRSADSLVALAAVLLAMVAGGIASLSDSLAVCILANFALTALILVLVANDPPMGNAGIYMFGYLFVSQTPVTGTALASRFALAGLLWVICGAVLVHKHHGKFSKVRLHHLVQGFCLGSSTTLWQLRLAAGITGALLLGQLLGLPRNVWVGYACMSVLLPYTPDIEPESSKSSDPKVVQTHATSPTGTEPPTADAKPPTSAPQAAGMEAPSEGAPSDSRTPESTAPKGTSSESTTSESTPKPSRNKAALRRGAQRIGGVVIGSVLFNVAAVIVPPQWRVLFGPAAGICIGFSNKYMVNNALNCFGALLLAEGVYGLAGSAVLRIWDNLIGVAFAIAFTLLLGYLEEHVPRRSANS